jgi:hypothetical protein
MSEEIFGHNVFKSNRLRVVILFFLLLETEN